jgi:hypothetical protein
MAALPQCIGAAKKLYDLRPRFHDASLLISAIYSESMVVAASLSQVQSLLQHDALLNKPELLDTFDRTLTGCRVVYGCLDDEVQDLARDSDRSALGTKQETFRELLTQIRGQQAALSLLILGLRMQSIPDMQRLVQDNSNKMDQVVKRSKTLRQSHPRISNVPESILRRKDQQEDVSDAESIFKSAGFAFDDEVINSKAYRRAMATYAAHADAVDLSTLDFDIGDDDSTALGTIAPGDPHKPLPLDIKKAPIDFEETSREYSALSEKAILAAKTAPKPDVDEQCDAPPTYTLKGANDSTLDSLERDMLPHMPSLSSKTSYLTPMRTDSFAAKTPATQQRPGIHDRAHSDGFQARIQDPPSSPPLEPGTHLRSGSLTVIPDKPRSASLTSMTDTSSYVAYKPPQESPGITRKPLRKPLPRSNRASREILSDYYPGLEVVESQFSQPEVVEPVRKMSEPGQEVLKPKLEVSKFAPDAPSHQRRVSEAGLEVAKPRLEVSDPGLEVVRPDMASSKPKSNDSKPSISHKSLESIEMHEVWTSLVDAESKLFDRLTKFRKMFYDNVIRQWPDMEKSLDVILVGERLAALHKKLLWLPMEQELIESDSAVCDPAIFETWASQTHDIYNEYCTSIPRTLGALRVLSSQDPKFAPFVNTLGLSIAYFGMGWEDYLKVPLLQLDLYVTQLQCLIDMAATLGGTAAKKEEAELSRALNAVTEFRATTWKVLNETQNRDDITSLEKRLHVPNPDYLDRLILHEAPRLLKHQGSLTMKLKGRGAWFTVHMVLLDNFLFWGKVKPLKDSKTAGDRVVLVDEVSLTPLPRTLPRLTRTAHPHNRPRRHATRRPARLHKINNVRRHPPQHSPVRHVRQAEERASQIMHMHAGRAVSGAEDLDGPFCRCDGHK